MEFNFLGGFDIWGVLGNIYNVILFIVIAGLIGATQEVGDENGIKRILDTFESQEEKFVVFDVVENKIKLI